MSALKKTLGPLGGAALMLNIVIGAGLLSLPGLAYAQSGSNAIWVWALCALVAVPLLLVFVIMGARYPNAGGIAYFSQQAFGRFAYIAASLLFLGAVSFGLPAIALVGGNYFGAFSGVDPTVAAIAILVIAASTQFASPEKASRISGVIASVVLVLLLVIIAVGFGGISAQDIAARPVALPTLTGAELLAPFMMIFFTFTGWEVASGTTEEFKNPKRDFPIAMALSFVVAIALYGAMALIVQFTPITGSYAAVFAEIISAQLGPLGEVLMSTTAVIIILANLMGAVWAVSRMVVSLSREGVIPLDLTTDTRGRSLGAAGCVMAVLLLVLCADLLGVLSIEGMLELAGQNFILLYAVAAGCLIKLSGKTLERLIAILSLAVVAVVLSFQGGVLWFPIGLVALSALIWGISIDPKPKGPD